MNSSEGADALAAWSFISTAINDNPDDGGKETGGEKMKRSPSLQVQRAAWYRLDVLRPTPLPRLPEPFALLLLSMKRVIRYLLLQ